jgi:Rrf2 family protein
VRITHRVDYGVRVLVTLARAEESRPGGLVSKQTLAAQEQLPGGFLEDVLRDLRNAELVHSRRGSEGGWGLNRPARDITVADIIRALEGPLASVRGIRPHEHAELGVDEPQVKRWVAVRAALRSVLEAVSVDDLARDRLPRRVLRWLEQPGAWETGSERPR